MEYVLYAVSVVCLGIGIYLFAKGKASAKKYMLLALDVAEAAAKLTKTKLDDQLISMLRKAIGESDDASVEKVMEKIKKED